MTEIRVEDGHGGSLTFLEVDGYVYPNFPVDTVRAVPRLDIRPDDVIVCAYPKSGTHWIWEMVRQLLALRKTQSGEHWCCNTLSNELGSLPVQEKDEGFLEMMAQTDLAKQSSPRALNTHVYFENLPTQVLTSGCRLVTLVRDPRDVAVSYYHHHSKLTDLYHYKGSWPHYLPLFLQGKLDYGSWFDYHVSWERGLRQHPRLTVLALAYEHVQQDSIGTLRQLAQFLDVPCTEAALRAVDKACSFDSMKVTKGPLETDHSGQPIMYRKGKAGDWKTVFTVQQAEHFASTYKAKISDLLALTSSSSDVRPYLTPLAAMYDVDRD